jgi:hypothetical protein
MTALQLVPERGIRAGNPLFVNFIIIDPLYYRTLTKTLACSP